MRGTSVRRLPSVDWIAFGVAVVALCVQYQHPVGIGLFSLAVFAPSVLRELGWLKDADEWTKGIMRRAGFHGLLAVAGVMVLNYLVTAVGWFEPEPLMPAPFSEEVHRKAITWVFLVSYIIQYWGAREGVFRILLAVAIAGASAVAAMNHFPREWGAAALAGVGLHTALMVGLAFLVRRWPRAGAAVLILLLLALVVFGVSQFRPEEPAAARWGMVQVWLQGGLIFGIGGLALMRESYSELNRGEDGA